MRNFLLLSRSYSLFISILISVLSRCKKRKTLHTWVTAEDQFVFVILTHNTEHVVLGIFSVPPKIFQVHSQCVITICGQAVNLIITKPKLSIQVTKSMFVITPIKEEINGSVESLLEDCPPPTGCWLVTKHVKSRQVVRFDFVDTVCSFTRFVDFIAVLLVSCSKK